MPSEVAQVMIQALDAKDKQTLLGLVATKMETAAIDEIYRKHGRSHDTKPAEAARLSAAGWQATYAFFEKGATYVTEERMEPAGAGGAETAMVIARGANASTGEPQLLIIELVQEGGLWKVKAGLQTGEAMPQR
ncbi:MAG: hypothetical protein JSV65_18870 [Armatimonadota bacterium]|nr:MAG: hypothetical protein JSV65_18870 [Armatimonadota bacterium]